MTLIWALARNLRTCAVMPREKAQGRKPKAESTDALSRGECAVYISARKKLIHAMSLDIDRPISRAVVVGCAISATCNYLKLHMSRTLKVFFCNTHAKTRKLWKRSAGLPPLETIPVDQFTSRPLLHFTRPPRCPLHSPRLPGVQTLHVASCSRRAYHRERRRQ